jgi:hypothetical protein
MKTKITYIVIAMLIFLGTAGIAQPNTLLDTYLKSTSYKGYEKEVKLPELTFQEKAKVAEVGQISSLEVYIEIFDPNDQKNLPEIDFDEYDLRPIFICFQCLYGCEAYGTPEHRNQCHRNSCDDKLHWFLFRKTK